MHGRRRALFTGGPGKIEPSGAPRREPPALAAFLLPLAKLFALHGDADEASPAVLSSLATSAVPFSAGISWRRSISEALSGTVRFPFGDTVGARIAVDRVGRRLSGRMTWKGRTNS